MSNPQAAALYRTLWRWHFYAALYVLPFIIILSLTGAIYLFKPQIDRWEERGFQGLSTTNAVSANAQLDAALSAFPGARFDSYRLPQRSGDAAMIHLALADGASMRDVFVSPQGQLLGDRDPAAATTSFIARIHSSLLAGRAGEWMVELAASWAIVMILTGLYLWWPRGRGLAGTLWPRRKSLMRDLHAVPGFWVSALALLLLISGLPWTSVWGDAFHSVRTELGLVQGKPNWKTSQHADHDHAAMLRQEASGLPMVALSQMVAKAEQEGLPFPTLVKPPGDEMVWTITSQAQNRPLNRAITFDMASGNEVTRTGFADKHPIDRAVNYGIAWHEGQLFGWVNQLIGVLTAVALVTLSVTGFLMWRKRKPAGLGAPASHSVPARMKGVAAIMILLALLLPLLALSLLLLWMFDRCALPRMPKLARWLCVS